MQRNGGDQFQFGYGYEPNPTYNSRFAFPTPVPPPQIPSPYGYGNFQQIYEPNPHPPRLRPGQPRPQTIPHGILPLVPPPMPPVFLWDGVPVRPPASITEFIIEDPSLPFVPEPAEKIDLIAMANSLQKQQEEATLATISNLTKQGIIKRSWPPQLKQMFQPLFCKLCSLSLSSAVVAMDHYKGKRHSRSVEQWLIAHGQKTQIEVQVPLSGSNALPIGQQGVKRKLDEFQYTPEPAIINKRFPLGKPPPPTFKKPKKDGNSGPNFDYCDICDLTLTSKATADQHYAGKPHKKKLLETRKTGNFDNVDRDFGIGKAFRVAENGSIQNSTF